MSRPRQSEKPVGIWLYSARSIGVTLLGLYGLEQAKRCFPNRTVRLFLVLTEQNPVYSQMLKQHSGIEIVFLRPRNAVFILRLFFQENHWVFPPSFGRYPFLIQIFAFLLTRNSKSSLVGFFDQVGFVEKLLYSRTPKINYCESIFKQVGDVFKSGPQLLPPNILFCRNSKLEVNLPSKYIVFHPYGAGRKRSYPPLLSLRLLKYLSKNYPDYSIVISGGPADEAQAQGLIKESAIGSASFINDLSRGSFNGVMQIIADASLYVGVDTGITHLAAHLNTPCLVLGNRSNPMWLPTYGEQVKVLLGQEQCSCDGKKGGRCSALVEEEEFFACLVNISWQEIADSIDTVLLWYDGGAEKILNC